ncbi:MAG TPA: hypothetical protein VFL98_01535 [Candidatus Paceibacterota bacterium]|nr:hypothetical protein [Candidatus Paceibacterota bacterium]
MPFSKISLLVPAVIVMLIALGLGSWFFVRYAMKPAAVGAAGLVPKVEKVGNALAPGMARFTHPRYAFSLDFPDSLGVTRDKEGNASEIDVFAPRDASSTSDERFQLFITPYAQATITQARLAEDIPNGDIRDMQEAVIGIGQAIHAAIFQSSDPLTHEQTREVWFIHDGFLFEVTAPFSADSWLASIMQTFRFASSTDHAADPQ